jgi:outer membrane lipoprotein-sorting protein
MGSTFSYGDLQIRDPEEGKHTRLKDMVLGGQPCYVVQTVPKNMNDSDYGKLIFWVRKDNFIPIRGEFYNKDNKLWKVLEIFNLEQKPDGTWVARQTKMSDVIARKVTVMEILKYQINVTIEDSVFTDRFLSDESQE